MLRHAKGLRSNDSEDHLPEESVSQGPMLLGRRPTIFEATRSGGLHRRGKAEILRPGWYYRSRGMTEEVVLTRRGQATIPVTLRKKYGLAEGSRLEVVDTGKGVLFKPKLSFFDASPKQMKQLLDRLREEDA